jgi:ABC-type multidrug transport system ATPase subunit
VLEAERFAEYLVILHGGRVVYQGSYRDLAERRRLVLRVDDADEALAVLRAAGYEALLGRRPGELYVEDASGRVDALLAYLSQRGVQVFDYRLEDLEELYWRIKDGLERAA